MTDRRIFESMDPASARFYSRVFNRAIMNAWAVRSGLFDILLCETEDPTVNRRWIEALPKIIAAMEQEKKNQEGEPPWTST